MSEKVNILEDTQTPLDERLRRRREDNRPLFMPGELCCDVAGFSLHAKVQIEATDREGLERLCRYIARPPIKVERLSLDPDGPNGSSRPFTQQRPA